MRASADEEIRVALLIHPIGKGVSAAEIRLRFDSSVLELLSLNFGSVLGADPLVLVSTVNNIAGEAHFALTRKGRTELPTETGELLTLRWRVRPDASPGFYTVRLATAQLTDENFDFIANVASQSLLFNVQ